MFFDTHSFKRILCASGGRYYSAAATLLVFFSDEKARNSIPEDPNTQITVFDPLWDNRGVLSLGPGGVPSVDRVSFARGVQGAKNYWVLSSSVFQSFFTYQITS